MHAKYKMAAITSNNDENCTNGNFVGSYNVSNRKKLKGSHRVHTH